MRVTVCALSDNAFDFAADWSALKAHVDEQEPDLLLLPEMPFSPWIAADRMVSEVVKRRAVELHEKKLTLLEQLKATHVVYSKPVLEGGHFFNTAFVFEKDAGHRKIHTKTLFPEEPGFWEETWFDHEEHETFELIDVGGIKIGVLLCTEMWFTQHARSYGKQGMDLLLCPRATGIGSVDHWVRCGQTLAVISGAYCLSSNRSGVGEEAFHWGGKGWIAEPMTGNLLGLTTVEGPFVTREIDIEKGRLAKKEYPLSVLDKSL